MNRAILLAALAAALLLTGCATKKYTKNEVSAAEARVTDRVDRQIGDVETQVERNQTRIDRNEQSIDAASKTAQEALERALEAGKLAEGKLLYETVMASDAVKFEFEKADLGDEARAFLDAARETP